MADKMIEMCRRLSDGCLVTATDVIRKDDRFELVKIPAGKGIDCLDDFGNPVNRRDYVPNKVSADAKAASDKKAASEKAAEEYKKTSMKQHAAELSSDKEAAKPKPKAKQSSKAALPDADK